MLEHPGHAYRARVPLLAPLAFVAVAALAFVTGRHTRHHHDHEARSACLCAVVHRMATPYRPPLEVQFIAYRPTPHAPVAAVFAERLADVALQPNAMHARR